MAFFTLETFPDHLASLPPEDWNKLFQYLPQLEEATQFGEWKMDPPDAQGVRQFPFVNYSQLVEKIVSALYDLGLIISFDWPEWEEGRGLLSAEKFKPEEFDAVTLCKLITAIVRNDRFCEGALLGAYENGSMPAILNALRTKVM